MVQQYTRFSPEQHVQLSETCVVMGPSPKRTVSALYKMHVSAHIRLRRSDMRMWLWAVDNRSTQGCAVDCVTSKSKSSAVLRAAISLRLSGRKRKASEAESTIPSCHNGQFRSNAWSRDRRHLPRHQSEEIVISALTQVSVLAR